ncbi:MAG: patatin-like phospholipase family protein [Desulfosudis oleivorans]|nr:patatin-like phospholipase family protein [Desulfosudis oleivorans]
MGDSNKLAVIMSGGGARAAYQVGVLKAVARILPAGRPNPFPIICGASAGAINAAALAIYAGNFQGAVRRLERVWGNFHVHHVFRTDAGGHAAQLGAMADGAVARRHGPAHNPVARCSTASRCAVLLERYLPMRAHPAVDRCRPALEALNITRSGYSSGQSVSFFQGVPGLAPLEARQRVGVPTTHHPRSPDGVIGDPAGVRGGADSTASTSATARCARSRRSARRCTSAPTGCWSSACARRPAADAPRPVEQAEYPSLAQIGGHVLASIFLDSLETDVERLRRINETVRLIPPEQRAAADSRAVRLRPVDVLLIAPSQNIGEIAVRHKQHFPHSVRRSLRGVGAWQRSGGDLLSYLLFEQPYDLGELGSSLSDADAMRRREEIEAFFAGDERLQAVASPLSQRVAGEVSAVCWKRPSRPFSTRLAAAQVRGSRRKSNTDVFDFPRDAALRRLSVGFAANRQRRRITPWSARRRHRSSPLPFKGEDGRWGWGWRGCTRARTQTNPSPPRPSATAPGVAPPRASRRSSPGRGGSHGGVPSRCSDTTAVEVKPLESLQQGWRFCLRGESNTDVFYFRATHPPAPPSSSFFNVNLPAPVADRAGFPFRQQRNAGLRDRFFHSVPRTENRRSDCAALIGPTISSHLRRCSHVGPD